MSSAPTSKRSRSVRGASLTIPAEPWTTFRRLGFHENAVARDHAAAVRPPPSCVSLAGQVSTRPYVKRVIVTETSPSPRQRPPAHGMTPLGSRLPGRA
jgi:hypothetical protein